MKNEFFKGHGLGNDYIAMDPRQLGFKLTPRIIRVLDLSEADLRPFRVGRETGAMGIDLPLPAMLPLVMPAAPASPAPAAPVPSPTPGPVAPVQ